MGLEKSRPPAAAVIASFTSSLFIEQTPIGVSLGNATRGVWGSWAAPIHVRALWNRERPGQRRDTANIRRARELSKTPSRDESLITLGRCRLTGQGGRALTGKGIDVLVGTDGGVGRVETIRQRLQKGYDLVLLLIRQAEHTGGHVEVVQDLFHRPAVHLFRGSRRAVSRRDVELKITHVARVVEMDELLQALDVAIMEELLLEIRYRLAVRVELACLGRRTLRRCQRHIARGRDLELAVGRRRKLQPISRVRIGG